MAVLDELDVSHVVQADSNPLAKMAIALAVWTLFNKTKDVSFKTKVGPVPISIKLAKLRWLIELWVGPEPSSWLQNRGA